MKMTHTTLMVLAAASMIPTASAAYIYTWTGAAGDNDYKNNSNWLCDGAATQWHPGSLNDEVTIANGDDVTAAYDGFSVGSLTLANDSSLAISGWGDYNTPVMNVEAGSCLTYDCGDLGGFDSTNVNLSGVIDAADGPLFVMNATTFWGGDSKHMTIAGTIDTSALIGSGSITVVDINFNNQSGGLSFDISGLSADNATFAWSGADLVMTYDIPAIPEPGTATLSLLALGALAVRRRRD